MASACYSERQPPPSFRYACDADGDCADGQSCIDGLCETPCTVATVADDCVNGELVCLNGVCSSGCEVGKNSCPPAQECADLGIDVSGSGSFFGGGGSGAAVGVCMRPCSDDSCGDLAVCLEGFCVPTCSEQVECSAGLVCTGGLCAPDVSSPSDTSSESGEPQTGSDSSESSSSESNSTGAAT